MTTQNWKNLQPAGQQLGQMIDATARTARIQRIWNGASKAMCRAGLIALTAACCLSLLAGLQLPWGLPLCISTASLLAGGILASVAASNRLEAAKSLDRRFGLPDTLLSAVQFQNLADPDVMHLLQIRKAEQVLVTHLQRRPLQLRTPADWRKSLVFTAFATMLTIIGPAVQRVSTAAADLQLRIPEDKQLALSEQLEELSEDSDDSELSQMLNQMNRTLQDFSERKMSPAEAFEALSDLDVSLQQLQQQLQDPGVQKQLTDIGEALSVSQQTAAAGKALKEGDFKAAAEELSQLKLPDLTSSEKRAVTEKLKTPQRTPTPSGERVNDAAEKIADGIEQNSSSQFQQGAEALAAESKKMASRQQLSQLLQQQAQLLAQARSDVEQQTRTAMQGPGRGGKKAGRGSDGDPRGENAAAADAVKEMRLAGTDSGQGDSDTELVEGEAETETASRQYREQASTYEFLSEQYLESEAVPAGQKQIIREYFRTIRPRNTGTVAPDISDDQ